MILTWLTNKLSAGVLDRPKCSQTCCRTFSDVTLPEAESIGKSFSILKIRKKGKNVLCILYLLNSRIISG